MMEKDAIKEVRMEQNRTLTRAGLRAPKAGAIAGIAFAVLLTSSFVLIRLAVPEDLRDAGVWLSGSGGESASP
jgi:hypothetical protein